jgi:hypothetical protein
MMKSVKRVGAASLSVLGAVKLSFTQVYKMGSFQAK